MNSHRWLPVTILLIVLSLCLVLTSRINYQEDISAFLPVDKETKEYTDVYSKLGGQDRIAVIFKGDSCQLIQAMDYFGDIVKQTDSLGLVNNLQVSIDEEYMLDVLNYVWRSYPLFLSDEYINELDTVLTLDYAKSQMEAKVIIRLLMDIFLINKKIKVLFYSLLHLELVNQNKTIN